MWRYISQLEIMPFQNTFWNAVQKNGHSLFLTRQCSTVCLLNSFSGSMNFMMSDTVQFRDIKGFHYTTAKESQKEFKKKMMEG